MRLSAKGQKRPPVAEDQSALWVFAYGSLMWRPDFPHDEARPALMRGYHRAMCVLSVHWRGTPERPGLVLGLDRGGSCRGRAFRVPAAEAEAVREALHAREMINNVYQPRHVPAMLDDGRRVRCYVFVADRRHPQYVRAGAAEAARIVRQGVGLAGSSRDYLASTIAHMEALGIREGALHRLLALVDGR